MAVCFDYNNSMAPCTADQNLPGCKDSQDEPCSMSGNLPDHSKCFDYAKNNEDCTKGKTCLLRDGDGKLCDSDEEAELEASLSQSKTKTSNKSGNDSAKESEVVTDSVEDAKCKDIFTSSSCTEGESCVDTSSGFLCDGSAPGVIVCIKLNPEDKSAQSICDDASDPECLDVMEGNQCVRAKKKTKVKEICKNPVDNKDCTEGESCVNTSTGYRCDGKTPEDKVCIYLNKDARSVKGICHDPTNPGCIDVLEGNQCVRKQTCVDYMKSLPNAPFACNEGDTCITTKGYYCDGRSKELVCIDKNTFEKCRSGEANCIKVADGKRC